MLTKNSGVANNPQIDLNLPSHVQVPLNNPEAVPEVIKGPNGSRKRTSKPKSKTGCKTCKLRRVKCDEGKPFCKRCHDFGRGCGGYERELPKTSASLNYTYRDILPKRQAETPTTSTGKMVIVKPLLWQLHPMHSFQMAPLDWQYFRYFQQETVHELSGGFDQPLWNVIVPQAFHNSACSRYIALSISALSRANRAKLARDPLDNLLAHYRYALQNYGKSLSVLRKSIDTDEVGNEEMLLVMGILIYCVEILQGNPERAIKHLQTLLSMLKTKHSLNLQHCHLDPSRGSGCRTRMDELRDEIARLDGQLTSRVENPEPNCATTLGITLKIYPALFDVPNEFSDFDTARRFLEDIQFRGRPPIVEEAKRGKVKPLTEHQHSFCSYESSQQILPSDELKSVRVRIIEWWTAFKPQFDKANSGERVENFVAIYILRIQSLTTSLVLETNIVAPVTDSLEISRIQGLLSWTTETVLATCKEILRLSWILIQDIKFVRGFVFDIGIIYCLFTVVVSSPDQRLGREALKILRAIGPRREGIWDSRKVADMAQIILMSQIKEEGRAWKQQTEAEAKFPYMAKFPYRLNHSELLPCLWEGSTEDFLAS